MSKKKSHTKKSFSKAAKKTFKYISLTVLGIGLFLSLLIGIIVYILFTPERLSPLVNSYTNRVIDAEFTCERVELTFFSTFPNFSLKIKNGCIVSKSLHKGEKEPYVYTKRDSLISFSSCYLSFDPIRAYKNNELVVHRIEFIGNQIYAYCDSLGKANWDISPSDSLEDDKETPDIFGFFRLLSVKDIILSNGELVYEDEEKLLFTKTNNLKIKISALLENEKADIGLAFMARNCFLQHDGVLLSSKNDLGFEGTFKAEPKRGRYSIAGSTLSINTLELKTEGWIESSNFDTFLMDLSLRIHTPALSMAKQLLPPDLLPMLKPYHLEGDFLLNAAIKGMYGKNTFPTVEASIRWDKGQFRAENLPDTFNEIHLDMHVYLDMLEKKKSRATIHQFKTKWGSSSIELKGNANNLLLDPSLEMRASFQVESSIIKTYNILPAETDVKGLIKGSLDIQSTLSSLMSQNLNKITANAEVQLDHFTYTSPPDSLSFKADHLALLFSLIPQNKLKSNSTQAYLSLNGKVLSCSTQDIQAKMGHVKLSLKADSLEHISSPAVQGDLSVEDLFLSAYDEILVQSSSSSLKYAISPNTQNSQSPFIQLLFNIKEAVVQQNTDKYSLSNCEFDLGMKLKSAMPDSCPYRSISIQDLPDYFLQFTEMENMKMIKSVIDSIDLNASLKVEKILLPTSLLPLPSVLFQLQIQMNNDQLSFQNFSLKIGQSDLSIQGSMPLLPCLFSSDPFIKAKLKLESNLLDCNELVTAFLNSSEPQAEVNQTANEALSGVPLLVEIPSFIDLEMATNIKKLLFNHTHFENVTGDLIVRNQHLLFDNLQLLSDLGEIKLTMLYEATSTEKAVAGLDLFMNQVDIKKLIHNIPTVDSIFPMLKSFEGIVNCQIVATTVFDSMLNVNLEATKASCYIKGKNLVVLDGESFQQISKMLFFKNKKRNLIDSLSVEFFMRENKIVFFPFPLRMDRYQVMLGGTQNADMTFDYHISLIKTPLPFRFGLRLYGDPDNIKYRFAKAKYKKLAKKSGELLNANYSNQRKQLYASILKNIQDIIKSPQTRKDCNK